MRLAMLLGLVACGRISFDARPDAADDLPRCQPATAVTDVELGEGFACAKLADGTLRCWGDGSNGQLGTGDFASSTTPAVPIGLDPVDSFALGIAHACSISGSAVRCWGRNQTSQLGNNTVVYAPAPIGVSLPSVASIATGGLNTCAVTQANELYCWGQENGTTTPTLRVPTRVTGVPAVTQVALSTSEQIFSSAHGCAVGTDGGVWCWGENEDGQLGVPTLTLSDTPVRSMLIEPATAVALGDIHTCALTVAREVYCWGAGDQGRLGDGTLDERFEPRRVQGLADVVELDAHRGVTCARTAVGEVYCWGANYADEIPGHPERIARVPVKLPFTAATAISVGQREACAIEDSILYCWGRERTDRATKSLTAVPVALPDVIAIHAAANRTCAVTSDNLLSCWGSNGFAEGGDGTFIDRTAPVAANSPAVRAASTGPQHTCVVHRSDDSVACWGRDEAGQITGTRSPHPEPAPVPITGITESIIRLSAGGNHTCAMASAGPIWCWGSNSEGQLGVPNSTTVSPPIVSQLPFSQAIDTGNSHTCVKTDAGALVCSGRNNEFQIDSMAGDAYTPRQVLPTLTTFSTSGHVSCVLGSTDVLCWGDNMYGTLATGSHANTAALTMVTAQGTEVVAGRRHVCARLLTTEVMCWGANDSGQLGNGNTTSTTAPVAATELDGATQLALGDHHTCGLFSDGTVRCVGSDTRGQLGDGGAAVDPRPSPAPISCP